MRWSWVCARHGPRCPSFLQLRPDLWARRLARAHELYLEGDTVALTTRHPGVMATLYA